MVKGKEKDQEKSEDSAIGTGNQQGIGKPVFGNPLEKKANPRPWTKVDRGGGGFTKTALVDEGKKELAREAKFLEQLANTGMVPKILKRADSQLTLEDVGTGEKVQDGAAFVMNSVLLLNELRSHGIRHGDLTSKNVIVRNDSPVVIDFAQATFADEGGPYKRPKPDAYYLWKTVAALVPARPVLRWEVVRKALGGDEDGAWDCLAGRKVTDFGCYDGETLAMAIAEGAEGVGVDSSPGVVAVAEDRWGRFGGRFTQAANLMDAIRVPLSDIVFMFSVWSHMVQGDRRKAEDFLRDLIKKSKVLFFETQLYGDGPGPEFLKTHDDVGKLLGKYGDAERLAILPVGGRKAERSVWSVK